MVGIVIKLEAKLMNPYSDKIVVGTDITIKHTIIYGERDKEGTVESVVFAPPNSLLPKIGDVLNVITEQVY